ncbi:hypothetical protein BOTBODRAFT_191112 [Botryobasidium botryosum FD-172 SS1]|uniref:CST complex subunit STN1 n=1 Tax=Botryobasidium botryosum (strain FD-172 SS1) TaxID=930990 RepID=A0A067MBV8_BOTB1|nr:hypothetical protein BOTBODRAFT_191112 [Botryobasidium botryosum FD-172 SS1]
MATATATITRTGLERTSSKSAISLNTSAPAVKEPTASEILGYTLRADAIALCFVQDVLQLRPAQTEVWWLGTVPVRTVRIVGIVVGVSEWEKYNKKYVSHTVDDGTGVIDCVFRYPNSPPQPPSPKKPRLAKSAGAAAKPAAGERLKPSPPSMPSYQLPIGTTVIATGKVYNFHGTKQMSVDETLQACATSMAEPEHWLKVMDLHANKYTKPFVIPPLPPAPAPMPAPAPSTPTKNRVRSKRGPLSGHEPENAASSSANSPSESVSSPATSTTTTDSPTKLRHPSRLRSRELTGNTFRIYLKHFMDNATSIEPPSRSPSPSPAPHMPSCNNVDITPTKPKASSRRLPPRSPERTPRPVKRPRDPPSEPVSLGFSLGYLRRVPELHELSRRVVEAERKRVEKLKRRKEREERQRTGKRLTEAERAPTATTTGKEAPRFKQKRLFIWAIRALYDEGAIILHDGPGRPIRRAEDEGEQGRGTMWRDLTSSSLGNSTTISSVGYSLGSVREESQALEDEEGYISDPDPGEECYAPVTPALLVDPLVAAIQGVIQRGKKTVHGPRRGAAVGDILRHLRHDQRWARIGEWAVDDGLEELARRERAFEIGKGLWALM